jgi:hypothetical protein
MPWGKSARREEERVEKEALTAAGSHEEEKEEEEEDDKGEEGEERPISMPLADQKFFHSSLCKENSSGEDAMLLARRWSLRAACSGGEEEGVVMSAEVVVVRMEVTNCQVWFPVMLKEGGMGVETREMTMAGAVAFSA